MPPTLSDKSSDPAVRHPSPVIALHWTAAALLLAVFGLVLAHDAVAQAPWHQALLQMHRWAGLLLWLIAVIRLVVRLRLGLAPSTADVPRLQRLAALAVQALLLGLLLSLPLLGWALTNARGAPVLLPGGWPLPLLLGRDLDLADTLEEVHGLAAWTLLGAVGLHATAAVWHHRVRRDQVLLAMWPWLRGHRVPQD